jgi:hypothetical protein
MPNAHSTNRPTNRLSQPTARLEPVPVGLFLASMSRPRRAALARLGIPDWHGLSPLDLAYLIRRYTGFGDVVLDLNEHPTVAAAARYIRRAPAKLVTYRGTNQVRLMPPPGADRPRRVMRRAGPGAKLILVTLPRTGAHSLDPHGMTRAMSTWRRLLRPGGHLIAALAARGADFSSEPGAVSHRSTVIAAGRAAGLIYHQHIPILLIPLPERDPRTDPEPSAEPVTGPDDWRLRGGRHLPAFRDLVVFAGTATAEEATRG